MRCRPLAGLTLGATFLALTAAGANAQQSAAVATAPAAPGPNPLTLGSLDEVRNWINGPGTGTKDIITFEALPRGLRPTQLFGANSGLGPVLVEGMNPNIPGANAACIFDSSGPTGGDFDLGTPHMSFGGPGTGRAGQMGAPFENSTAQGNILIVAESLFDGNSDGLIDNPDDVDALGSQFQFDFTAVGPIVPRAIFIIDVEADRPNATVEFFDSSMTSLGVVVLPAVGDNGAEMVPISKIYGAEHATVLLNGSGAIDDFCFELFVDCDDNGIHDPDEIVNDCNNNGVLDICEPDCDEDGVPDDCDDDPDCDMNGVQDNCEPLVDCNNNGIPDRCELDNNDCNQNGIPDECDPDCDNDTIPDDCDDDPDCDMNGVPDNCEPLIDCNSNGIPDRCELVDNDCDQNGVPDECDPDCDTDGIPDACDPDPDCDMNGVQDNCEPAIDCNNNGIPDRCELVDNDCNQNGVPDECDPDCDNDTIPDECDDDPDCDMNGVQDNCEPLVDCNNNGIPDRCELDNNDCDQNGVPDECDPDCDTDGIPDDCDDDPDCDMNGVQDNCEPFDDCNSNGIPDRCELDGNDCDQNGVPDECDPDCDTDGIPDDCDDDPDCDMNGVQDNCEPFDDCNSNGIPDRCELDGNDCDQNGVPDECDPDCDTDGIPDDCDDDPDCDMNGVQDNCEPFDDCNSNGIPDRCELDNNDCDHNGVPDECDPDCDHDGIPDECDDEPDCDDNGTPDNCEPFDDCNYNGIPDRCELDGNDCNDNHIPDECEPDCDEDGIPDECDENDDKTIFCARDAIADECALYGGDHSLVLFEIGDFLADSNFEFTIRPDNTARLSGIVRKSDDPHKRFLIDLHMCDIVNPGDAGYPPEGSPKRELHDECYVEDGGSIDTNTWDYARTIFGTLTGLDDYEGAVYLIMQRGSACQLGVGANGKNQNFGGSTWLTVERLAAPHYGHLPYDSDGDINIDLRPCEPDDDVVWCPEPAVPDPDWSNSQYTHTFFLPGIGRDFVFVDCEELVEKSDGTAFYSGILARTSNFDERFFVSLWLSDRVDPGDANYPPPGSPKRGLLEHAYDDNGGPVDTDTFRYYETWLGTLTGLGDHLGAVIYITRRGPSFQIGFGANDKNLNYGASGWFGADTLRQPCDGYLPYWIDGDTNIDLNECLDDCLAYPGAGDICGAACEYGWHHSHATWGLDEDSGSTAFETAAGNHGTYVNGVSLGRSGAYDGSLAAKFDGNNDCIDVPASPDFQLDEGTISLWIRPDDIEPRQGILSREAYGYDGGGHLTMWLNEGRIQIRLQGTDSSHWVQSGFIPEREWTKVTFSFGPQGMKLFIDDNLVDMDGWTGGIAGNNEPIVIGASAVWSDDGTNNNLVDHYDGKIDHIEILPGSF